MRQVIIHTMIQASKKVKQGLRAGLHLSAPSNAATGPKRKDRIGLILALLAITLLIAIFLLL